MKKIVLTFGLLAGAVLAAMMFLTLPFQDKIGYDRAEVIGYTSMVVAFLLVFFGIRSFRDNVSGGQIGFLKALGVGLQIVAVASICYVAAWQVIYYKLEPDFVTKYQNHLVEKARASGATEEQIAARKAEVEQFAKMYQNPVINAAVTFLEPLPAGVILALVSAGILSRRRKQASGDAIISGARVST